MPTTLTLSPTGQTLTVPTRWADVSFEQFVALLAPPADETRTTADILLGLEAGALDQLAAADVAYLGHLLTFALDPTPVTELLPTPGLPDPGRLPWGCLVLCQQHYEAQADRPELVSLPFVLAVYRCQMRYGSTERLEEMLAEVLVAPVTETYPDAAFFHAAWPRSRSATPPTSATTTSLPTKKLKPARPTWLSALGRPWRYMPWRTATC